VLGGGGGGAGGGRPREAAEGPIGGGASEREIDGHCKRSTRHRGTSEDCGTRPSGPGTGNHRVAKLVGRQPDCPVHWSRPECLLPYL
jgi:hypothetical protein